MSRPESDRHYRTGVFILLSIILTLGLPLGGLAELAPSDPVFVRVYLPMLTRAMIYVERTGILDTSFGDGGLVLTDLTAGDDEGVAMAVQRDGKLLVGGEVGDEDSYNLDLAVARYNLDGSLDTTFGNNGWVRTNLDDWNDAASDVIVQPDGKILLAGTSRSDFVLVRYTADGSLDTSFDVDGWARTDIFVYSEDESKAVAVQPDGRILVAGYATNSNGDYDFALVRYLADGSLDADFGGDGRVTTDLTGDQDQIKAIAIQPDGKIIVVGPVKNGAHLHDFAVARYNSNGTLDTSFGVGGWVLTDFYGGHDFAYAVALQLDGGIVVAGAADIVEDQAAVAVARYTSDGKLDPTFSDGGSLVTDFGEGNDYGYAVCMQPDGKVIVGGYAHNGLNDDFALVRYNPNGSPDASFGGDGMVVTDIAEGEDKGLAVALQVDGRIIITGSAFNGTDYDFAVARYK